MSNGYIDLDGTGNREPTSVELKAVARALPIRRHLTLLVIGDSLFNQAHSAAAGSVQSSAREIVGWLEFFSKGLLRCSVWYDAADPYSRNFSGYNFGVSGTQIASIITRGTAARLLNADIVMLDGMTNDVDTAGDVVDLTNAALDELGNYAKGGSMVIYRSIPVRSAWPTVVNTQTNNKLRAARINELMRLGIAQIPGAIYWDVNQVRSKPALALAGAQYTNYVVSDATHSTMAGAVAEAYALWNRVLSKLLPVRASILPSSDDVYHATLNPYGWMTNATAASSNFRLSGSAAAAATGTSGFKPTNTTFDRLAGDGTAVGSKLTASDGNTSDGSDTLEDAARIVLTPVSTDTTMQLRFGTFLHGLSVGTWVEGMAYVDIKGAPDFFKGVPFQVKDITNAGSVTNFTSTGLAAYDPGSSGHVTGQRSLPNKNMCGTIWSPPFQVIGDAFSLNIPISYWGGASGTGQVDALFLGVRPIPDPTVVF